MSWLLKAWGLVKGLFLTGGNQYRNQPPMVKPGMIWAVIGVIVIIGLVIALKILMS